MYGWTSVNDGGTWRTHQKGIYVMVGGALKFVRQVYAHDGTDWREVHQASHPDATVHGTSDAAFGLLRAGTMSLLGSGNISSGLLTNWYWGTDIGSTIGDNYAIKIETISAVNATPSYIGCSPGVWTTIAGTRGVQLQGGASSSGVFQVSIATDVAPSNIHCVFRITLMENA